VSEDEETGREETKKPHRKLKPLVVSGSQSKNPKEEMNEEASTVQYTLVKVLR
jgi:hypothetical protein